MPISRVPYRADARRPGFLRSIAGALAACSALAVIAVAYLVLDDAKGQAAAAPALHPAALTVNRAVATQKQWPAMLDAAGTIAPWQEAIIGSQVAGLRLIELRANIGDTVRRGQVLARFDPETLRADRAQLEAALGQAEALSAQADANRDRALKLKGSGGISEQELLQHLTQAETARAQVALARAQLTSRELQLRHAEVRAPDDGVISARSATLGAVGAAGQELFRLIRQGRLEWRGELTAAQMALAHRGQRVLLALPDGRDTEAQLRQLAPSFDGQSRLGLVYADLPAGSPARAGMYASGRIVLAQRPALVVPASSLVVRDGRSHVLRLAGSQRIQRVSLQAVEVGRRQGREAEIKQGLAAGDLVVAEGAGFLHDGDTVQLAAEPSAGPQGN